MVFEFAFSSAQNRFTTFIFSLFLVDAEGYVAFLHLVLFTDF